MKSREWLKRGDTATDSFDALSNYWRGFNGLYAGKGQERELISQFLTSRITDQFASGLLDAHAGKISCLISEPVIDMRGNGRDTSQHIENFGAASTSVERLVALFMVIYQVRCNFEHGQKSPFRKRDKALCEAACPFVAEVVRHTSSPSC